MVLQLARLVHQVVGIYPYAVPTHQPGHELEEIPLRTRRLYHIVGIDADAREDDRELVHQGDIHIPLGILYDFPSLGHLDIGGSVHPGLHH